MEITWAYEKAFLLANKISDPWYSNAIVYIHKITINKQFLEMLPVY